MSMIVSPEVLKATSHESLTLFRSQAARNDEVDRVIDTTQLGVDALKDLGKAASQVADSKIRRAIESILLGRSGKFDKPIPNFNSFKDVLTEYLRHDLIDGWVYTLHRDGFYYPYLVTNITFQPASKSTETPAQVSIHLAAYGRGESGRTDHTSKKIIVSPGDVHRQRVADILANEGLFKETKELKQAYTASMERYTGSIVSGFAKQYRFTGLSYAFVADDYKRYSEKLIERKVIHDLDAGRRRAFKESAESILLKDGEAGQVPAHPVVYLFDLGAHEWYWGHSDQLSEYQYDKSLRDKLILPASHRDLLDVLTTNLGAFVDDIIEGKSAGNIILAKGEAGLGKTLTAEVYCELMELPLYRLHSGQLGTTPKEVEKALKEVFQLAKRWGCVLLLDECDVFVAKRKDNIVQNAIVAEFLRVLEYVDGLVFMTTNRPNDIDDAFLSRCAAIIEYGYPVEADLRSIWGVMARQFKVDLSPSLLNELIAMFPRIAARDVKNLFRLALRVSAGKGEPLSSEVFRMCAMFRGLTANKVGDLEAAA